MSILRIHIVLVAIFGTLVFGWLITGRYLWIVALISGLDWLLINLANRVSDVVEDLANRIPGAERVAAKPTVFLALFIVLLAGSFVFTVRFFPEITFWRVLIQITGIFYNFKIIPAKGGFARLKDRYFFKNVLSAFGFFITCFGYPLAMAKYNVPLGWGYVVALVLYFTPYELTFEIFYDLRDVDGDRKAGVNTYPVVHGQEVSVKIINALLALSCSVLIGSFFMRIVGVREMLMMGGPVIGYLVMRRLIPQGTTIAHCVWITHLATALQIMFLVGTALWLKAGMPANVFW